MLRVIAAVLVGLCATLLPGAPALAAPGPTGNGAWAVGPATTSSTLTPRLYFSLEGRPGDVIRDTVRVWNHTAKKMTFQVYPADGYNTPRDGAFALRTAEEAQKGVGLWTKVGEDEISVPAGRALDVPFTVTIPDNATPGEHIGGVVVANKAIERAEQAGGATIGLRRAVGARVYLRVSGTLVPGVRIDGLRVENTEPELPWGGPKGTVIKYTVANVGNVRLTPSIHVKATGLFGRVLRDFPARGLPELLPGQSLDLELPWAGAPPADKVTVVAELSTRGGLQSVARTGYTTLPWQTLVAVSVLALAVLLLVRLRRRLTARRKA
ncbi:WxL protein peptidoglycan domain-containing protein [Actinocorallia sp. A-T 12471]|uniref:WxL protein peptidoglycan domain-containing protein n=1 Tax=Actinocorallia sp. A-T 12471 TaxID=3089813 RepID=UPI0029D3F10B|nr:DUF916 domain-containing protein [Actinocorallia sp. A-T 12471]MDX6744360.1 DUF916 domain-containing protein [Actinocorallia sp. A-T 12471]